MSDRDGHVQNVVTYIEISLDRADGNRRRRVENDHLIDPMGCRPRNHVKIVQQPHALMVRRSSFECRKTILRKFPQNSQTRCIPAIWVRRAASMETAALDLGPVAVE